MDEGAAGCSCRAEPDEEVEAEDGWWKNERERNGGLRDAARQGAARGRRDAGDPERKRRTEEEQQQGGDGREAECQAERGEIHEGKCSGSLWGGGDNAELHHHAKGVH